MELTVFAAYLATCVVVVIIPGPTVTLIVANSMTHGPRAGLLSVAGTQVALAVMMGAVVAGLAAAVASLGHWFDWLRLAGAAYLVWLGIKLWRSAPSAAAGTSAAPRAPRGGFLLQGFLVGISNPKTLLFFGALIPQFLDPHGNYALQMLLMGVTNNVVAATSDSAYALAAGRARGWFSRRRAVIASRLGGTFLIGGGLWLAASRSR